MSPRVALSAALVALAGCQVVAGIDTRTIDPRYVGAAGQAGAGASGSTGGNGGAGGGNAGSSASGAAGASGASGASSCASGAAVAAGVRLANLVPDGAIVEFCASPAGAGVGSSMPLFHASASCPAGLSYLEVSAPIALAPGAYDVRVVTAGAPCASAASAVLTDVVVSKGLVTLLRAGGAGAKEELLARAEHVPGGLSSSEEIRFIHAMPGAGTLDFGSTKPALPSSLTAVVGTGVAFGSTLPPSPAGVTPPFGVIDAQGYIAGPGYDVTFGVTETGASDAFAVIATPKNIYATIFAVGTAGDPARPPELLLCREDASVGPLAACTTSLRHEVVVDAFAVDLSGIVSPHEDERRPYIEAALAKLSSDVVCLTEVGRQKDRDAIVAAASLQMNVATFTYDETSAPGNAADLSGNVPPPPAAPACAGPSQSQKLKALGDCVSTHCSSVPGSAAGHVTDIDCVTQSCSGEYASFFGAADDQACLLCLQAGVDSFTPIEEFQTRCQTVTRRAYTFGGQGSVVLLSRLPFVPGSVGGLVLPSTLVRREVVKATVQVGNGSIDVYCGILGEVYTVLVPYSGPYGDGASGPKGWANEQLLQAKRWLEWVAATSTGDRTVIAGQLYASAEHKNADGAVAVSGNLGAPTLSLFQQSFPEALAAGYVPACTRCTTNPLVNDSVLGESPPGPWHTHVFAKGPPSLHVTTTERTFLEATVPIDDGKGGTITVPLSRNYGMRTRIALE